MESKYHYFKRDISWLSFNYRVLLEADDDSLPLYERINFISIYSSNLEEFYKIRVAEHKAIASGGQSDDMTQEEARHLIHQITEAVNSQMEDRIRIYEHKIVPALRRHHIIFYQSKQEVEPFHQEFISNFFKEEIFPYLQPVPVCKNRIKTFLRDNRLYLSVRVTRKDTGEKEYYIIKLPYSKVPRFIELPRQGENFYLMYMEDIIKANINRMFPGYDLDCSYCCKISRDADIFVDDATSSEVMVEQLRKKVKKRKIGAVCRFVYDRKMPADYLEFLVDAFGINRDDLVPGDIMSTCFFFVCNKQLSGVKDSFLPFCQRLSSKRPHPLSQSLRLCQLSRRESPWQNGKLCRTAKASPFEESLPPAGGRCRTATKGGVWHCISNDGEGEDACRYDSCNTFSINTTYRRTPK